MTDFNQFLNIIAEGKKVAVESNPGKKRLSELKQELHPSKIVQENKVEDEQPLLTEVIVPEVKPASQIHTQSEIDKYLRRGASFQQPDPNVVDPNTKAIQEKLKFLEQAVGRIAATGPGSGEVRLEYLDDVDRSTIGPNRHLAYNPTTKKFFFEEIANSDEVVGDGDTIQVEDNVVSVINLPENTAIGPIEQLSFNTSHTHQEERVPGTLCWDVEDRTLNLTHPDDVTQQIGQELYGKVRNNTGTAIVNGTAVRFSGASMNGSARLEVAPFLANGTFPSLYGFGIATQDIEDGSDGLVTVWGKVRGLNTTGGSENWQVGDILFVSPTVAGALTNVKPTAPNNVVPMAAILRVDSTEGEIFVRPTVEQQQKYGRFARNTDLNVTQTNTAGVVTFDTTEISNGVDIVTGNTSRLQVSESGLYQIDISAQIDATGGGFSSGTMFVWVRKNGVDVPGSTRRQGVLGSAPSASLGFAISISLDANDYVEVAYAGNSTSLLFNAESATAFAPSTSSVKVGVTQVQL